MIYVLMTLGIEKFNAKTLILGLETKDTDSVPISAANQICGFK